jgi:hypothetical protein
MLHELRDAAISLRSAMKTSPILEKVLWAQTLLDFAALVTIVYFLVTR